MMSEEELYKLAISDVPKYSLLNEILAIRDKRFPNEETDYTINVYGSISLDVLNKYVDIVNNWNELNRVLNGLLDNENDFYSVMRIKDLLKLMQELENRKV